MRIRKALGLAFLLSLAWPVMAAGGGSVSCEILENGQPASGTVALLAGEKEVAQGSCGKPLSVPPGDYTAVLSLDGALDGPQERKPVTVKASGTAKISADFATGLLEVRIKSQGRDTAGMAVIRKGGTQIGTLGSGVAAHLSAGTYEVVARYRTQQRAFPDVAIKKGDRTVLEAAFE